MTFGKPYDPPQSFLEPLGALGKTDPEVALVAGSKRITGSNANIFLRQKALNVIQSILTADHAWKRVKRTLR